MSQPRTSPHWRCAFLLVYDEEKERGMAAKERKKKDDEKRDGRSDPLACIFPPRQSGLHVHLLPLISFAHTRNFDVSAYKHTEWTREMAKFIRALDSKHLIIAGGYVKDASLDVEEVDLIGDISDRNPTYDARPIALPLCTMLTARLMPGCSRDDS